MEITEKFFTYAAAAVCHGLPERSLAAGGAPLPFCARCAGLYIGVFAAFIYLCVKKRLNGDALPGPLFIFAAVTMAPLMIDGATSYAGLRESGNMMRLITGALFGTALPAPLVLAANFAPERGGENRIIKNFREYGFILAAAAVAGYLFYVGAVPRFAAAIILCAGMILTFYLFFYMLTCYFIRRLSRYNKNIISVFLSAAAVIVLNIIRAAAGV